MPIKCPLSRIIKPRKVQGVDCFEVSWEEMDGLKTSIVPADLVERYVNNKLILTLICCNELIDDYNSVCKNLYYLPVTSGILGHVETKCMNSGHSNCLVIMCADWRSIQMKI